MKKLGWTIAEYGTNEPAFLAIKHGSTTVCTFGSRDQAGITEADRVAAQLIISAITYLEHAVGTDAAIRLSN